MSLTKDGKLDIIRSQRGPLEHEMFAVQTEVEVKEEAVKHGATGVTQEIVEEAKARRNAVQAQIDKLDQRKAEVEKEPDNQDEEG